MPFLSLTTLLLAAPQASARYYHYHHWYHSSHSRSSHHQAARSSEEYNSIAAAQVRALTGRRTRLVWVQTTTDICGKMPGLFRLMGMDTDDGRAIRVIVPRMGGCIKPMITPDGDQIVFTNLFDESQIYVVNWDGTGLRKLLRGYAVFLWKDPNTGVQWVYARAGHGNYNDPIRRFRLDRPQESQLIWNKTRVGQETYCWFRVSADGTRAGAAFPWPECGEATLPNGTWQKWGAGCWTSMAPDN
ncbi:MAG: hypothetical protein M3Y56_08680, partial [Armatimonadota bacterium]|nr:hypothetical protein [Armatimonadota bacterium]